MTHLLWLTLPACVTPAPHVAADADALGVHVRADMPMSAIVVFDAEGGVVARRTLPTRTTTADVTVDLDPGHYRVEVRTPRGLDPRDEGPATASFERIADPPVRVEVMATPGQPWFAAAGDIGVPIGPAGDTEVLVAITAGPGHPPHVSWSEGAPIPLAAPGVRETRHISLTATAAAEVTIGEAHFRLVPVPIDTAALASTLTIHDLAFPADADGAPDPGRSAWQVTVAEPWWLGLTHWAGLGLRGIDDHSPWAWAAVGVANGGDTPVDVMLTLKVTRDGVDAPPFRPRLRSADGDTGVVAALLRVPARGEAAAALPVFVDVARVEDGPYDLSVEVAPLGGSAVHTATQTLRVRHGDTSASLGFVSTLALSLGGSVWLLRRVRGWLENSSTTDLVTIALFGTALFLVGSASDLLSMGVAAILGPFSTLLTGLVQDVVRTVLLATLLTLLPRVGTLSLALLAGWLGRALTTGGLSPVDLVYTGATVALAEGFAWLAGLTRGGAWRDAPPFLRWVRLSIAFGGAGASTTLSGLCLHIVLYRLYFADWYIAMQVLGPGFLYVLVACALAVPFAASLREVDA